MRLPVEERGVYCNACRQNSFPCGNCVDLTLRQLHCKCTQQIGLGLRPSGRTATGYLALSWPAITDGFDPSPKSLPVGVATLHNRGLRLMCWLVRATMLLSTKRSMRFGAEAPNIRM